MVEFCQDIKVVRQPSPSKNPGGDCFACAATGALGHLFPENPPSFETVWDYFWNTTYKSEKKDLNNTWPGLDQALHRANSDGYKIDIYDDLVLPKFDAMYHSHGFYVTNMNTDYTRRLEGWLRSGWVVFAEIDLYGRGAYVNDRVNSPDHIVLLDGIREVFERVSEHGRRMENYIHVTCSAKGPYWIKTQDLLRKHGAAGWKLIRRENFV